MRTINRPPKITFAEMRATGVIGIPVYCENSQAGRWTARCLFVDDVWLAKAI
jgi:hypothetical protein